MKALTPPPYPIVDAHVHIAPWRTVHPDARAVMAAGRDDLDELRALTTDPYRLIGEMDRCGIEKLVLINYVAPQVLGFTEEANEYSAHMAQPFPERLIPFGGIDPRRVRDVAAEMDHLLGEPGRAGAAGLGLRGIKLHPSHQWLHVNAYHTDSTLKGLATVYEKCIQYDVPVMVHTGTSIFPRARNKFADPMDLDDVLVDFPDLKVIIAHGGRPLWMETCRFLLRRSQNAYLDISSIPPKRLLVYFPWLEAVSDRAIYGSDWPGPGVKNLRQNSLDVYQLPLSEAAKKAILRENALRLLAPGNEAHSNSGWLSAKD